jgi:hypothetical protein
MDPRGTPLRVRLGEVCHSKATMTLPGAGSQITEAPCPNSCGAAAGFALHGCSSKYMLHVN